MRCHITVQWPGIAFAAMAAVTSVSAAPAEEANEADRPTWAAVEGYVERHFSADPSYRSGDIISKSQVTPLFKGLRRLGWTVPRAGAVLSDVPGDTDFVVRHLRTKNGQKFMRRVSNYPDAYDRLYRLAALSDGRKLLHDLVQSTGGEKLVEYLSTTPGGKNLGEMLGGTARGVDFNRPVGKIFTVNTLLKRLQTSYEDESGVSG